ncbi:FhaA domain-containing protein [Streptomyces sp. NPDC021224]|uniref:FhaA domain-containing protein n=1 Tax=unclassified Streptomyces TaxID=2593676 RepID=UPI0037B1E296
MGVLKRFEQRLEGLVNGTFAKVFKSEVQPVEIAGALQRECDNNATIWNRDRTVVPNDFIVELSGTDFERLSPYAIQLGDELAGMVRDYAKQQRYTFMGSIKVHLERADDLDTGLYRVRSRTLASSESQHPQNPQQAQQFPPERQQRPAAYQQQAPQGYPPQHAPYPPAGGPPALPAAGPRPAAPPPMPAAPPPGGGARPGAPVTRLPGTGVPAGAPGASMRRWIEINGTRHQITRQTLVLGRSTEADVRVDDPGVSRKHCEIRVGMPSLVQDLGSTNGIVVDGQHTQRATLRDGSRIVVGSTTIVYRQAEG